MLLQVLPQRGKERVSNGIWTYIYKLLGHGLKFQWGSEVIVTLFYVIDMQRPLVARWVYLLMYVKWALFLYFFTRHVSDKDRQSKLYRNVQPVFSIDDEDEDGGIDLTVWFKCFESECTVWCMNCSCRRTTANWDYISITHQTVVTLEGNKKELSC